MIRTKKMLFKAILLLSFSCFSLSNLASCGSGVDVSSNNTSNNTSIAISNENTHRVTFVNMDGSILYECDVEDGSVAIYEGKEPTYEEDGQFEYEFSHWDYDGPIYEDREIKAIYNEKIKEFFVSFLNYDDSLLFETKVHYGEQAIYEGEIPTRESDDEYDYTFVGWDFNEPIFEDKDIHALYQSSERTYSVKFVNYNGEILFETSCNKGEIPTYLGNEPVKEEDEDYEYVFIGWDKDITSVSENTVYTAVFDQIEKSIFITYINHMGEEVYVDEIKKGETPSNDVIVLNMYEDEDNYYYFVKWDITGPVYEDTVIEPIFESQAKEFVVTYVNYDGSILYTTSCKYGETPTYEGEEPTRLSSNQYDYEFIGFDYTGAIYDDTTITALYTSKDRTFKVVFKNYDGSVLEETSVVYGGDAYYTKEEPTRESDEQYNYVFLGWNQSCYRITSDLELEAQYTKILNKYSIVYKNYNGNVLYQYDLEYGSTPTYNGPNPTKPSDEQYDYVFAGWDKTETSITGDTEFTAKFDAVLRKFTVNFYGENDKLLYSSLVEYGSSAQYFGEEPTKESTDRLDYSFVGWNKSLDNITSDTSFYAQFSISNERLKVTFLNYDLSILNTIYVEYGSSAIYDGNTPTKNINDYYTYTFVGWDEDISSVTSDIEVVAQFSKSYDLNYEIIEENGEKYAEVIYKNIPTDLETLIIPSTITKNNVTYEVRSYNSSALNYSAENISSIYIPSTIKYFKNYFSGSKYIENIYYDGTIEDWCNIRFDYATSNPMYSAVHFNILNNSNSYEELLNVEIPNSISQIGDYQFFGLSSLSDVKFGSSITSVGSSSFGYCTSLSNVIYDGDMNSWCNINFNNFDSNPMSNANRFLINNNGIYEELNSIVLDSQIDVIKAYTFYGFDNLKEVIYTNRFGRIEKGAFQNCSNLEKITLPFIGEKYMLEQDSDGSVVSGKRFIGHIFGASNYNENNNYVPASLKEVTITDLTIIDEYAFANCSNIEIINLPTSLQVIGNYAFYKCSSLKEITIPDQVLQIGKNILSECKSLNSIKTPFLGNYSDGSDITSFSYFFTEYKYDNVVYTAYINQTIKEVTITKASFISDYAFYKFNSIVTINLYDSITTIGKRAFYQCASLENINLPNSITSIGNDSFEYCTSLKEITIPEKLSIIRTNTFSHCTNLKYVYIKEDSRLETIENWAFDACKNLISIYLPRACKTIANEAFRYCSKLSIICNSDSIVESSNHPFGNVSVLYIQRFTSEIKEYDIDNFHIVLIGNDISITKYYGEDSYVEIPTYFKIDGTLYEVKYLNNCAFFYSNAKVIYFSLGNADIGKYAFYTSSNTILLYRYSEEYANSTYPDTFWDFGEIYFDVKPSDISINDNMCYLLLNGEQVKIADL